MEGFPGERRRARRAANQETEKKPVSSRRDAGAPQGLPPGLLPRPPLPFLRERLVEVAEEPVEAVEHLAEGPLLLDRQRIAPAEDALERASCPPRSAGDRFAPGLPPPGGAASSPPIPSPRRFILSGRPLMIWMALWRSFRSHPRVSRIFSRVSSDGRCRPVS